MSMQINLFNPALLKQKAVFTAATMATSLAVLLVGVTALATYGRISVASLERQASAGAEQLAQRKTRQAAVQVEFAPRVKSQQVALQIAEAEAQMRALREVEVVLRRGEFGNTDGYAAYFKALARQSTDGLWLTGVTISGAGKQLGLLGRALEPTLVPAYITRLTREPVMQGKSFGSLQMNRAVLLEQSGVAPAGDARPGNKSPELAPYVDFSLQAELLDKRAEVMK